jgi:ribosomal-protein-alanine N-acetyltransferase
MPVGFEHIELVGEKVRLRPIRETDAAEAFSLFKDDRVLSRLLTEGSASVDEQREVYRGMTERLRTGESYNLSIEEVSSPGVIGGISARPRLHPQQIDIGYWLGVPYWNKGYMTEAVRLVCYSSFELLDAARAYATVFTNNMASRKVLEKNGFSVDGTLRAHVFKRGEWRDEWFLSLLRPEWEVGKERYTPRHENIVFIKEK